uniref:Uncharacterized protein n=2 Tax=Salix viminalis TaxID=40686 RepID=A0A6N2K9U0_SALVM
MGQATVEASTWANLQTRMLQGHDLFAVNRKRREAHSDRSLEANHYTSKIIAQNFHDGRSSNNGGEERILAIVSCYVRGEDFKILLSCAILAPPSKFASSFSK